MKRCRKMIDLREASTTPYLCPSTPGLFWFNKTGVFFPQGFFSYCLRLFLLIKSFSLVSQSSSPSGSSLMGHGNSEWLMVIYRPLQISVLYQYSNQCCFCVLTTLCTHKGSSCVRNGVGWWTFELKTACLHWEGSKVKSCCHQWWERETWD